MADERPEQRGEPALEGATRRATGSGEEIAQFFGTSSPMTMSTTVDTAVPRTSAREPAAEPGTPAARSGPASRAATDGSASMPITRLVRVMPSCAPESWKVSDRTAASAPGAPGTPRSTASSSAERSTVVRENSAATNTPQARVSTRATPSSRTSVTTPPS